MMQTAEGWGLVDPWQDELNLLLKVTPSSITRTDIYVVCLITADTNHFSFEQNYPAHGILISL